MESSSGKTERMLAMNPITKDNPNPKIISEIVFKDLNMLVPFKNHPFKLYEGQRFLDMVESVRANGVLVPIVVRPLVDEYEKYEILSGHNRVAAAKVAEIKSVPAIVRNGLTDAEALLIVTETNILQRSFTDMCHSEKAIVLATHYEAIKKNPGYRSDLLQEIEKLTCAPVEHRMRTREKIGEQFGIKNTTVARYLRVNNLISELKDRLDNGEIGMRVAEALSYLKVQEQEIVDGMLVSGKKVSIKLADVLKEKSEKRELNEISINEIFDPEFFPSKIKPVKLSGKFLSQHFNPNQCTDEIEDIIAKALDQYFSDRE